MVTAVSKKHFEQVFKYVSFIVQLIFFGLWLYALSVTDWDMLFIVTQAILVSFVPYLLYRLYEINTPQVFQSGIVSFMFATLILGEIATFYSKFWWWDTVLHLIAGIGLTIISFISLALFFKKSVLRSTPLFTTMLAVSVTIFLAVIWEVYEFIIDLYFDPSNPLQPSNQDTMIDLIVGLAGACLSGIFGYRLLKWRDGGIVGMLIEDTVKSNKNITRKLQDS